MKKSLKIVIATLSIIILLLVILVLTISILTSPVSSDETSKKIVIPSGASFNNIATILKENNVIRNEKAFVIYLKLNKIDNIYAATYYLNESMNLQEVVKELLAGGENASEVSITFKEGLNMSGIAKVISDNTSNSYDSVFSTINDKAYLKTLINKYWFLSDDILASNIYYPLEGYLFPETYRLDSKNVDVKYILEKMLNHTNTVLNEYKEKLTNNKYSIHQLITLASIVELEGIDKSSRATVASVFYNRLNANWSLGSDVTTYYGAKIDLSERDLKQSEINASNGYNTRNSNMAGKLPVGAICNPGEESIKATLYPTTTDYYYFVADKNNKVYFSKTDKEHQAIIKELRAKGLWYEW